MDDSFRLRADKVFGSLSASLSSSLQPPQSSPWSVAGAEVERRQWRRATDAPDRDETPCASSFQGEFGIGSSIGMDPTLDFEEEEDEYDKVASGAEAVDDDRLFMDDVTNHGSYLNSYNVLIGKDSRANHLAARHRLKEDDAEAQNPSSTPVASAALVKQQFAKSPEDGGQPKPILKRKDNSSDSKSRKRVRFDPAFVDQSDGEESSGKVQNLVPDIGSGLTASRVSLKKKTASQVPDYLVNPSKYTCYSFDSTSEVDEGGNTKACMDYITQVESSGSEMEMEDASPQLPKSVTFVPKKKTVDGSTRTKQDEEDDDKQSLNIKGVAVAIAAMEENEIRPAEEEDKSEQNAAVLSDCLSKSGRKFRTKPMSDDESD
ncbi:putative tumor suppressing sub-chromosomal transferable candidate 4 [Rosa chinensis]|uniref:Putative tumor suppressing sub-chromosomal transferable candidate 4 n=1 Tax=Rosa chinensis TaxID=74649 RepID=A0A2P6R070_ROSCH|nr:uncharacterized protein LOC112197164 [Rosa chinensis]PRQ39779.1 putative tumor suppressing sub-chromosomal transferable candidate 4 [Rosa chinensis]